MIRVCFLFFLLFSAQASAEGELHSEFQYRIDVDKLFKDPTRPRTKAEIEKAYRWLVDPSDGVSEREAKLIAQKALADRGLEEEYDPSKPKVLEETESHFIVRFPSQFMIGRGASIIRFRVDRALGDAVLMEKDPEEEGGRKDSGS